MNNEAGLFPAVGDIVHFIDDHAAHAPAIVLHIRGDHPRRLWLRVLGIGHADYERHWVEHGDERGTWHWPESPAAEQS